MATNRSSLSSLLKQMQTSVKVRPDLRTNLCEEVEQWVVEAEGIQVEEITDHEFKCLLDVNDLVKEEPKVGGSTVKEPEVEGSTVKEPRDSAPVVEPIAVSPESPEPSGTVQPVRTKWQPMFLSSEEEGEDAPTPKKARIEQGSQQPHLEVARSPSPKLVAVEQPPALLAEVDKVPQSVVKQDYPEHAFLLGWKIFIGPEMVMKPVNCGQCLCYNHTCSGQAGKMCGQCICDHQACVSPEDYKAKEEKDAMEAEVKDRGMKAKVRVKVKDRGSTAGPSSISSKGILDTSESTRTSTLFTKERVEELVEKLEELIRNVSVKLNELNGIVLELEGPGDD
ncbi:hypothetical protein JB92DRAFT_3106766 [Gautieria morchelliformis]|nr:hypothetical protein JB92DRAFT_3106766 [Gautieria morchelliformis]